ncbi:AEC family transporter [Runella sp. CRIBMP]|jgi:predicted permease|uniref:AEC family transporter n=1 Tax=Runella sp. CRIBMP TaxID=2683261 RepID=UPI0014125FDE|nr:AEC family transporter [Runella sp. CRIBMP]NBB20138.1 AEC family transporter [Runella sp. CRIBMP]
MNQTNSVFLITLGIATMGFLIKKFDFVTEQDGKAISKFLMHTTFPALMIVSMLRIKFEPTLFLIPLICIALGVVMTLVGWVWFKDYPNRLRGVLTMSCGGLNVGLFAFPIIEGIWGREGLVYVAMFDIGNTIITFGLVYSVGSYFAVKGEGRVNYGRVLKKVIQLPPLQAMFIGLTINALKIELPVVAYDFLDVLAKANKPLVLLLMGIYMSFSLERSQVWAVVKVLTIRYACGFIAILLLYVLIPEPTLARNVLLVCVILPIGMTILPFADELNYDSRIAGVLVNISLLISFLLMWGLVVGLKLA